MYALDLKSMTDTPASPASAAAPVRPSARRQTMRARRRRSMRVLMAVLAVIFVLFVAPRAVQTMAHTDAPESITYTVGYGDTLWDIAEHYTVRGDVRKVINTIMEANHLTSGTVYPGQTLIIPKTRQVAAK